MSYFKEIDINKIGGTDVSNQGNAPGSMPSANLDSFGNPLVAVNINATNPTTSDNLSGLISNSIILGRDASYGSWQAIGSTLDLGTFNSRLWVEPFVNGQPIGDTNPVPIKNAVNDQRQRYTGSDTTVYNYSFNTKNLESYLLSDDPTGVTFDADLLWSPDGGTTLVVLKKFTQADLVNGPVGISGRYVLPNATFNFYAIRMNSITLTTATWVDFSTYAMAI